MEKIGGILNYNILSVLMHVGPTILYSAGADELCVEMSFLPRRISLLGAAEGFRGPNCSIATGCTEWCGRGSIIYSRESETMNSVYCPRALTISPTGQLTLTGNNCTLSSADCLSVYMYASA